MDIEDSLTRTLEGLWRLHALQQDTLFLHKILCLKHLSIFQSDLLGMLQTRRCAWNSFIIDCESKRINSSNRLSLINFARRCLKTVRLYESRLGQIAPQLTALYGQSHDNFLSGLKEQTARCLEDGAPIRQFLCQQANKLHKRYLAEIDCLVLRLNKFTINQIVQLESFKGSKAEQLAQNEDSVRAIIRYQKNVLTRAFEPVAVQSSAAIDLHMNSSARVYEINWASFNLPEEGICEFVASRYQRQLKQLISRNTTNIAVLEKHINYSKEKKSQSEYKKEAPKLILQLGAQNKVAIVTQYSAKREGISAALIVNSRRKLIRCPPLKPRMDRNSNQPLEFYQSTKNLPMREVVFNFCLEDRQELHTIQPKSIRIRRRIASRNTNNGDFTPKVSTFS